MARSVRHAVVRRSPMTALELPWRQAHRPRRVWRRRFQRRCFETLVAFGAHVPRVARRGDNAGKQQFLDELRGGTARQGVAASSALPVSSSTVSRVGRAWVAHRNAIRNLLGLLYRILERLLGVLAGFRQRATNIASRFPHEVFAVRACLPARVTHVTRELVDTTTDRCERLRCGTAERPRPSTRQRLRGRSWSRPRERPRSDMDLRPDRSPA